VPWPAVLRKNEAPDDDCFSFHEAFAGACVYCFFLFGFLFYTPISSVLVGVYDIWQGAREHLTVAVGFRVPTEEFGIKARQMAGNRPPATFEPPPSNCV
jgi:hypothetical protein